MDLGDLPESIIFILMQPLLFLNRMANSINQMLIGRRSIQLRYHSELN